MEDKLVMDFKYGDIILDCPQCGTRTILAENLVDGRAIYLFQRHDSYVRLECPNCKVALEMRMIESTNPPVEEYVPNVEVAYESGEFPNVESSNENIDMNTFTIYDTVDEEIISNIENEELQENITEEKTV